MKILFVNPFFTPWAPGGAEHSLEQMCGHFSEQDWQVDVLATAFDDRAIDENRNGYWVRWVRAPFKIPFGQDIYAEHYLETKFFRQSMLDRYNRLKKPDVILANNGQAYDIARYIGRSDKIPVIGIVRDTQLLCEFGACMDNNSAHDAVPCQGNIGAAFCSIKFQRIRGIGGWRPIPAWCWHGIKMNKRRVRKRSLVSEFEHIVTISKALEILFKKAMPEIAPNRFSVIRNFSTQIEPDISGAKEFLKARKLLPGKFFLFAGRKTYGKGIDLLVSATAVARQICPECSSVMLGRGAINDTKKMVDGCIDVESVPQSLLLGLLKQSAALVIPGRWQEGLHRTMIDAINMGKPVICTQAGAPPIDGVLDGGNGIVVRCENSSELAQAMCEVLSWSDRKKEECERISHQIFLDRFSDEVILKQWSKVLDACRR